jgi:hypothetical protein
MSNRNSNYVPVDKSIFESGSRERFEYSFVLTPVTPYISLIDFILEVEKDAIDLGNGYKKYETEDFVYYWTEENSNISLAVSFAVQPYALVVCDVYYTKNSARLAMLFSKIIHDRKTTEFSFNNICIGSRHVPYNRRAFWSLMMNTGVIVSWYDVSFPGGSFIDMSGLNETVAQNNANTRYVISEFGSNFNETRSTFGTRRTREVGGML